MMKNLQFLQTPLVAKIEPLTTENHKSTTNYNNNKAINRLIHKYLKLKSINKRSNEKILYSNTIITRLQRDLIQERKKQMVILSKQTNNFIKSKYKIEKLKKNERNLLEINSKLRNEAISLKQDIKMYRNRQMKQIEQNSNKVKSKKYF